MQHYFCIGYRRNFHRPHTGVFRVHYFIFWGRWDRGFWLCDIASLVMYCNDACDKITVQDCSTLFYTQWMRRRKPCDQRSQRSDQEASKHQWRSGQQNSMKTVTTKHPEDQWLQSILKTSGCKPSWRPVATSILKTSGYKHPEDQWLQSILKTTLQSILTIRCKRSILTIRGTTHHKINMKIWCYKTQAWKCWELQCTLEIRSHKYHKLGSTRHPWDQGLKRITGVRGYTKASLIQF